MHTDTSLGSGSAPWRAPAVGPPVTRPALPSPQARSPPPGPRLTQRRRAQLVAAIPQVRGPLLLLPPPPPPPTPSSSVWLAFRWPQSRKPRRRVLEKRYKRPWDADKVPAAESSPGRAAAAQKEKNAEPAGPTDALTIPQVALPRRAPCVAQVSPRRQGLRAPFL